VRGDVIEAHEPEAVAAALGRVDAPHPGKERHGSTPLDEAERGVPERGRDRERGERSFVALDVLDVGDRRSAPRLEQREGALGVLHAAGDRAHAVRVLGEEALRATAVPERHRAHDRTVSRAKRERALAVPRDLLGAALADEREVEAIDVEAATALEVAHVIVDAFDSEDSERLDCHGEHLVAGPDAALYGSEARSSLTLSEPPSSGKLCIPLRASNRCSE